jgi:hypothetical protein
MGLIFGDFMPGATADVSGSLLPLTQIVLGIQDFQSQESKVFISKFRDDTVMFH